MLLLNFDAKAAAGGKLVGHRVDAAAGGIAQRFDAGNRPQRLNQRREHRAVALQFAIEAQLFTQIKDGCAVVAQSAADNQHVARRQARRAPMNVGGNRAHPGGVDKQFIRRAATDDLGIAGDDCDVCRFGRFSHGVNHRFQRLQRQTLFDNKPAGEITGDRAADRHVVGGAAYRQLADIAAGEEQRVNHIAVGGKREAVAVRGQ